MSDTCVDLLDSALVWLCVGLLPLVCEFIVVHHVVFDLLSLAPHGVVQLSSASSSRLLLPLSARLLVVFIPGCCWVILPSPCNNSSHTYTTLLTCDDNVAGAGIAVS